MNAATKKTDRFVAKEQAGVWIVGDRWTMRITSKHNSRIAAEYAARYYNRAWDWAGKQMA